MVLVHRVSTGRWYTAHVVYLANILIGKAVQEAYAAVKSEGGPTWLTYTLFADPLTTVRDEVSS